MDDFTKIEHIDQIKSVFLPKVEYFSKSFDVFNASVREVKEVVRRFDEDLCIKASKSDL